MACPTDADEGFSEVCLHAFDVAAQHAIGAVAVDYGSICVKLAWKQAGVGFGSFYYHWVEVAQPHRCSVDLEPSGLVNPSFIKILNQNGHATDFGPGPVF